jgi:hypothetical protein
MSRVSIVTDGANKSSAIASLFFDSHKPGVFRSIADFQAAIHRYLREHNDDPKPFVWTKPAGAILAKLNRLPVPSV